jgi:hypothetical protein
MTTTFQPLQDRRVGWSGAPQCQALATEADILPQ